MSAAGSAAPHPAWIRAVLLLAVIAAAPGPAAAQALTGTTGLVSIPTAQMAPDRTVTVGVHVVDRQFNGYPGLGVDEYRSMVQFVRVGFLPFAEVGLRLSRLVDYDEPQALGDRMVSVRMRVLPERRTTPAVVVGAHDIVGTRLFHALYVVGSKEVNSIAGVGAVSAHLGYGGHLRGVAARGYQFQGVFGGVAVAARPWLVLMVEHDADAVNAGVRLHPVPTVALLAALHADGAYSGGISYTHRLR